MRLPQKTLQTTQDETPADADGDRKCPAKDQEGIPVDEDTERRYPSRERKKPSRLDDYVTDDLDDSISSVTHTSFIHHCYRMSHDPIPVTYQEAIASPEGHQWKKAMDEEIASLQDNNTYELTSLPKNRTAVGGRWIYQVKPGPNGKGKFRRQSS
ncbi:uncharacterized protein LOC122254637 [Penaeus japonicus]|uniref:uncharacterized protein LOC122254637 n=1 Tax=Penaeus japonicus TaxID=27405 RepID=UPI001C71381F|nr:uncharacterized protein LOC122254637 [Penaeus japonicus]